MSFAKGIVVVHAETLARTGIAPDDLMHETTQQGFSVWNKLRGARKFPPREAVTPRAFAEMLDRSVLVRVLPGHAW